MVAELAVPGGPAAPGCLIAEHPDTGSQLTDGTPSGAVTFYLVAARNACGENALDLVDVVCESPGNDSDADGVADLLDNCPLAGNAGQADADLDFVGDPCDNCPQVYNPDQADADADSTGDACK